MRLIYPIIALIIAGILTRHAPAAEVSEGPPSSETLLAGLERANAWINHCSMKVVTQASQSGFASFTDARNVAIYQQDDDQIDITTLSSSRHRGNVLTWDSTPTIEKSRCIINKQRMYQYATNTQGKISLVMSSRIPDTLRGAFESFSEDESYGAFLNGKCSCNETNTIAMLLRAGKATVTVQQKINNEPCYALTAKTPYGLITAWIAPAKGYNCLRFTIDKQPDDLYYDHKASTSTVAGGFVNTCHLTLDNVRLQQIAGRFICTKGVLTTRYILDSGKTAVRVTTSARSDINLAPDFKAKNAFVPADIPDGTRVLEAGLSGNVALIFELHGGEVVPRIDRPAVANIQHTVAALAIAPPLSDQSHGRLWVTVLLATSVAMVLLVWFFRRRSIHDAN